MTSMATKSARKILVIDDDTAVLDLLIERLKNEVSVSYASEGGKAQELGKQYRPDLILLDAMMPDMSGFEVCRGLKADPDTRHIPIVFLTGRGDENDIAKGLELGAIDYITEPFDAEVIIAKVRNILKQIDATRAAAGPEGQGISAGGETGDRRADGPRRPDRIPKVAPDGAMERRAEGQARPDRFAKPAEKPQGMSLAKFLVIALFVAIAGGGGFAWYSNAPGNGDGGSGTTAGTEPAAPVKSLGLTEEDIQSVISENQDKSPNDSQATPSGASLQSCGDLPKVPWWGSASHDSIINYVNNKADGDWNAYIAKWERQLEKLDGIYARDGTVIAPKLGTRLSGPTLAEYITQVETRLEVTRCLAKSRGGQ